MTNGLGIRFKDKIYKRERKLLQWKRKCSK